MAGKNVFLRMCRTCNNNTVIIKPGDEEAMCPVCDTNHKIEWLPKTHAIANATKRDLK